MEKVLGIGGVFLKAKDPVALAAWYREHLGVAVESGQTYAIFQSAGADEVSVFATFPNDSDYFGRDTSRFMINFRVRDLDAMLAQLRAAGVEVEDRIEELDQGRFGWVDDAEGNRIELWQPS